MNLSIKITFWLSLFSVVLCFTKSAIAGNHELDSLIELSNRKNLHDTVKADVLSKIFDKLSRTEPEVASRYVRTALELSLKNNYKRGVANAYTSMGIFYYTKGDYDSTLFFYLKALTLYEQLNNNEGIARIYNNIGGVCYSQHNYSKALEYHQKSLAVKEKAGDKKGIAASLNNIGNVYYSLKKSKQALLYRLRALKYYEEIDFKPGLSATLNNIGLQYEDEKDYINAIVYYEKALKIKEAISEINGMAMIQISLGSVYSNLGDYKKANEYLFKGLKTATSIDARPEIKDAYLELAKNYKKMREDALAYDYLFRYSSLKDSLLNEDISTELVEMQTRYESEKKEKEIALLNTQQAQKNAELSNQMFIRNTLISVVVFILAITFILLRAYRGKKEANSKLISKNAVIEEQKKLVDEKNKEITDSINYSKRLQQAILPSLKQIKECLPESFIYYLPKDIVAGDFYWVEKIDNSVFIAAADCTGHGVPGAMVSVVCSNAIKRAVKEFGLINTGEILDKVRELIIEFFKDSESEIKDGMDISLLSLEFSANRLLSGVEGSDEKFKIQWSGANNPLWYVQDGEMKQIKPDKQPVAYFPNPKPFTTHTLSVNKGTCFYLFTDGFPDQFGGPNGKKFKYKQLSDLIVSVSAKSMDEQKNVLSETFNVWKANYEQVDDVCILGIKV